MHLVLEALPRCRCLTALLTCIASSISETINFASLLRLEAIEYVSDNGYDAQVEGAARTAVAEDHKPAASAISLVGFNKVLLSRFRAAAFLEHRVVGVNRGIPASEDQPLRNLTCSVRPPTILLSVACRSPRGSLAAWRSRVPSCARHERP